MIGKMSLPVLNSSTDFFRWVSDYLEDVIRSLDPKKRTNLNVFPLQLNKSLFEKRFGEGHNHQVEKNLSRNVNMKLTIKKTKDMNFFYMFFSKESKFSQKPVAVFEKKIEDLAIWYFFSLGNKTLLTRICKSLCRSPFFDSFWVDPDTLRNKIIDNGELSGFTARFRPIDQKKGLHGKGRRTIRLWGKNASDELDLVENTLFTKAYSMNFERGTQNPGPISLSIDINGQIATKGGHSGAFRIFMDSLFSFEELMKIERGNDQELYLKIGETLNPKTGKRTNLSILNSIHLKLDDIQDDDLNGIKALFLCSPKYAGNIVWEDPPNFSIQTIDKIDGSPLYIHVVTNKKEIVVSPTYESNFGTRDRAHQALIYSINPRFVGHNINDFHRGG